MKNCKVECEVYFDVKKDESQYHLSDFVFKDLEILAIEDRFDPKAVENIVLKNVTVVCDD